MYTGINELTLEYNPNTNTYSAESILKSLYTTSILLNYKYTPKRFYVKYKDNEIYVTVSYNRKKHQLNDLLAHLNKRISDLITYTDKLTNSPMFLRDFPEGE